VTATARVLHALVRGYQAVLGQRPSPCRFSPTCSAYALDALEAHGARRGAWLAARRLARCHPWGGQGWDPVPERKAA
jgi:putative membrane protein insertion efficiency factor